MNTVGKTLVVVNLLFALLTGGFLVVDFMTRENWKKRVDDYKHELEIAQAKTGEDGFTIGKVTVALREAQKKISELENKVKDDESKSKRDVAEAKAEAETERGNSQKQQLASMVSLGENERLKEENKKLTETLARREKTINGLEVDKNNAVNQAITFQSQKQAADERQRQPAGACGRTGKGDDPGQRARGRAGRDGSQEQQRAQAAAGLRQGDH